MSGNLTALSALFLAYNWFGAYLPGYLGHNGFTLKRVLITQFWGTQGLLGTGAGVSATYIFLFVLLGSFLKYSGFSKFINDFSMADSKTSNVITAGRTMPGFYPIYEMNTDGSYKLDEMCIRDSG